MPGPIFALDFSTNTTLYAKRAEAAVEAILERHGGPCPAAHADLLRDFIMASGEGRTALFLAVASRALGCPEGATKSIGDQKIADDVAQRIKRQEV
jgi:hypothetical protein